MPAFGGFPLDVTGMELHIEGHAVIMILIIIITHCCDDYENYGTLHCDVKTLSRDKMLGEGDNITVSRDSTPLQTWVTAILYLFQNMVEYKN